MFKSSAYRLIKSASFLSQYSITSSENSLFGECVHLTLDAGYCRASYDQQIVPFNSYGGTAEVKCQ